MAFVPIAIIFFIIHCLKMQLRLKNLYKRLFFSAETSYILNNLTLQITDVEINQLYNEALRDNFYKIWKPVTIVALFNLCVRVYQISFVRDTPPIRLMGAFLRLSFCLMWGLLKWKFRNFKMPALLVFLYSLAWCMITNFSFSSSMIPRSMSRSTSEPSAFSRMMYTHLSLPASLN